MELMRFELTTSCMPCIGFLIHKNIFHNDLAICTYPACTHTCTDNPENTQKQHDSLPPELLSIAKGLTRSAGAYQSGNQGTCEDSQRGLTSEQMKPFFKEWHELSKEFLYEDFWEAWMMFVDIWEGKKVKYPKKKYVEVALQRARKRQGQPPRPAIEWCDDPNVRLVDDTLYELQRLRPNQNIWLTGEKAGEIMGKKQKTGWLTLNYLCHMKNLEFKKQGNSELSNEYQYIGKAKPTQGALSPTQVERKRQNMIKQLRDNPE